MLKRSSVCLICFLILPVIVFGQSSWVQKTDHPRIDGTMWGCSFTIGTKAYITGAGGITLICGCLYEYDQGLDAWTQKANVPYQASIGPAGFAIGNKGYVCGGNQGVNWLFYEYDPALNSWTQKANLPIEIMATVGFSIGNKGYVVCGQSNPNFTDNVWEYDPSFNSWAQKASFPGGPRAYAVGFAIGSKGYFGTGNDQGNPGTNDFWQFDPASNTWQQKANLPGLPRNSASGFSVSGKGYIGLGHDSISGPAGMLNDFWEYDTLTNVWTSIADFATHRKLAVGFSIGTKGYVVGGVDSTSTSTQQPIRDLWEYPDTALSVIPVLANEKFNISPNPTSGTIKLNSTISGSAEIKVYNSIGEKPYQKNILLQKQNTFDFSELPSGMYFLEIKNQKISNTLKFIKE